METRVCCKCNIEQPLCEYGVQKNGPNGLRSQCRSCRRIEAKEYRKQNLDKVKGAKKRWSDNNPGYNKEYAKNNPEKIRTIQNNYYKRNPFTVRWRGLLSDTLKRLGMKKEGHTIDVLGYSALDLKNHLESLFSDGMTWGNYGEWHIDHVIGVTNFNKYSDIKLVNALSNLRPLWATTREINGVIYEGNLNRPKY